MKARTSPGGGGGKGRAAQRKSFKKGGTEVNSSGLSGERTKETFEKKGGKGELEQETVTPPERNQSKGPI